MNRILSLVLFVIIFSVSAIVSQAEEQTTQSAPTVSPVSPSNSNAPVSLKGKVLATYDNSEFILKENENYFVVQMGKEFWPLGIARGDTIQMDGVMKPQSLLKNEVVARRIVILTKIQFEDPPLGLRTIEEVIDRSPENDLVAVRGTLSGFKKNTLLLIGTHRIVFVPFGLINPKDNFKEGDDLIVVGTVKKVLGERAINPIVVRPASAFMRQEEPTLVQPIKTILRDRPIEKRVKARGRIAQFIGKTNATLLYEGENLLLVYPSQKYLSLDAPAGTEVTVVGTFDVEMQRGREQGVLREARIDRVSLAR